jgi:hypothetical protein
MAQQFPHHEYYFIDSFYPAIALMLAFSIPAINLIGKKPRLVASIIVSLAMAGFIYSASGTLNSLYQFQPWDRNEITRQNFINTDKYLDSIGVARTSKVLVLDSYNTNAALTLMNRKGYTVIWTKKENIEEGLSKPFDIVAIQNCFIASDVVKNDSSIITQIEKFADNGLVSFYQRKNNPNQTFNGFFGITKDNTLYNFASDFQSDSSQRGWSTFILSREKHFSPPSSVLVDVKDEFSPTFEMKSNEINLVGHAKILLTGKILRETNKKQEIVASLKNKDENYYYMNFAIQDYTIDSPLWQNFMFQFVVPELKSGDDKLSIYFWNPDKGKFYLDDMALTIYK